MIPRYLKIKGLYSYQKEQEINFEPLTDASLFGIFGAVGSGKSSILEAITFALYGDTERLNRSGDDRTYNMMNLRSDELLIDFECIAGKNGEKYRFTVRGKRNSKNFKEVKTFERRAYIWLDETWVPLSENETTEDIIGLSYDNFRRTIIIPQGRFQEFIELKDAERTRMMKELFQLEKYDLSRNVGILSKKNDLEISGVEGQLLGLGTVTPEMITEEEEKRRLLGQQIVLTQNELNVQTEQENEFQKLKLAFEKVQLLQNQLTSLEARLGEMNLREETLRVFEICSIHFKTLLDQKKSLLNSLERDRRAFTKNELRAAQLEILVAGQRQLLAEIKPQYEKREELLDVAEELGTVIRIKDNILLQEKKTANQILGEKLLREKELEIDAVKQEKKEKENDNETKKQLLTDISELSLVKTWFATLDEIQSNRKSIKKEAEDLQAEIANRLGALAEKTKHANTLFGLTIPVEASQDLIQNAVQQLLAANEGRKEEIEKQVLQINTRLALQQYASNLTDGEPCPLCGSAHHPAVLHLDSDLGEEIIDKERQRLHLQKQDQLIRQFASATEIDFGQIATLEKQKISIKTRYRDVQEREKGHIQDFVWMKFDKDKREEFDLYFSQVNQNQKEIRENEIQIKNLGEKTELLNLEKTEKIEKPLQTLRDEILKIENTVATLSGQLKKVDFEDFKYRENAALSEMIAEKKISYEKITTQYEKTDAEIDTLEKEKDILSGSQATLSSALETATKELESVQLLIDSQLTDHGFGSETFVVEILANPISTAGEKKILDEFRASLGNTRRDLESLTAENAGQVYDAAKHELAINIKNSLTANLNAQRKEEGRLDGLLKKMVEDLARQVFLLKEKARLLLRKEHLDDLARLFRSSGFVDYASSIYLQNLIQAANHRFHQMTHQRLHLELGEGNSFWVRDLLNGGHLRLLKTLSGGQKFQAALSLALALADHIHVRNQSVHNFFFLDEGFGSLDKNALQTVFETLKSLRKENRIVGIISHVEDLQQEIQTYLTIEDSEDGSRIITSWGG